MLLKILKCLVLAQLVSCASFKSNKTYNITNNIKYGPHPRHVGDFYRSTRKNAPLIVTVHGGGWDSRDRTDMESIVLSLASHGYNVFNINYRLAPEFKHPAPIEDLTLAIEFMKKKYGHIYDTKKIALWGYSAGTQIVMLYGLKKENQVSAIVGGGGPYDFTWWPESPIITPYMGHKRDDNIQAWLDASPITHLTKDAPPIFLYHGIEDELVEYQQMTYFDGKAKLLGVDIETHGVDFWGHANTFLFSDESVRKGILFLNKRLLQ